MDQSGSSELEEEITDSETAEEVVRNHLITSPVMREIFLAEIKLKYFPSSAAPQSSGRPDSSTTSCE